MTTSRGWDLITGDRERDRRNVSILLESVEELYGVYTMDELQRRVVDRAIRVTGAERGFLLLDGAGSTPRVAVARDAKGRDLTPPLRYSGTAVERVRTTGQPLKYLDTDDPTSRLVTHSILTLKLLSIMAVPLPIQGRGLGVLYVDSTAQAKEFTDAELAVFKVLGGVAALAVENGRLLEERVQRERMARDLAAARTIQRNLLPESITAPPGFDLAAEGRPCDETSGDYYDVIPLRDGRVALVMGDVSGHGLPSALLMTSTRAMLRVLLSTAPDPASVVGTLNALLEQDVPPGFFVSLFLGILDPELRRLTWVNAGHNPPLRASRDGSLQELVGTGPVLGILPAEEARYETAPYVALAAGDAVVLYTDGIPEARNAADEMYGEERFHVSLRRRVAGTRGAGDLLRSLLADLDEFMKGRPPADDVTCLVLRVD